MYLLRKVFICTGYTNTQKRILRLDFSTIFSIVVFYLGVLVYLCTSLHYHLSIAIHSRNLYLPSIWTRLGRNAVTTGRCRKRHTSMHAPYPIWKSFPFYKDPSLPCNEDISYSPKKPFPFTISLTLPASPVCKLMSSEDASPGFINP